MNLCDWSQQNRKQPQIAVAFDTGFTLNLLNLFLATDVLRPSSGLMDKVIPLSQVNGDCDSRRSVNL